MSSRPFTVTVPVRFPEVDSYGIVWHGHYVAYLEIARNRYCDAMGITPGEALAVGLQVPVISLQLGYRRPARLDDILTVACRLKQPHTAKLVFDYEILRTKPGAPDARLVTATTEQVVLRNGELLVVLPDLFKTLADRFLAYQAGTLEAGQPRLLG